MDKKEYIKGDDVANVELIKEMLFGVVAECTKRPAKVITTESMLKRQEKQQTPTQISLVCNWN